MMAKEKLRNLKMLKATSKMIDIAKNNNINEKGKNASGYSTVKLRYNYQFLLRCQNLEGFIKIAIFYPKKVQQGILTPSEELFINEQTGENITRLLDDKYNETGWSNRYIGNSYDCSVPQLWYCKNYAYINRDGKQTISQLGNHRDAFLNIYEFQKTARKNKLDLREKKKLEEWDADMALVPDPPADIAEWMHKHLIREQFIFYNKKADTCYCTYCRKEMPLERRIPVMKEIYKHNNRARCYVCGREVKMKNLNQLAMITNTGGYWYQLISKLSDNRGIVLREFRIRQYYKKENYKNPYNEVVETKRIFYDGTNIKRYQYELYKNSYYRWVNRDNNSYYYDSSQLYKTNLRSLNQVIGKKSGILQYIRKGNTDIHRYMAIEVKKPYLEKIVKAGFYELAKDIMQYSSFKPGAEFNEKETELVKIMCIDKNRLNRFKTMDKQDGTTLCWLQEEKRNNTQYPNSIINEMSLEGLIPSSFDFLNKKMTYLQIYNYLIKQTEPDDSLGTTRVTWTDYINMAKKVGMNIENEQIYKPKDLKAAHNRCIKIMQQGEMKVMALKLEKEWPTANDVIKTLKKYEYIGEKYSVIAPKSIYDIVVEGTILGHCVHTCDYYFDRIQRRESYILFLRYSDKPDVSYYTLEVEPSGNIRQKRTTGDNQNKDFEKAVDFLKEWQQVIKLRLDDEDKKLGKKSDELRKKNYAELRKNGNKIWHGRLAGKLLAQVLEDDFMLV
ncbi:MAG: PcfJ domain-containing protein [Lachnospiraceae bacterium]|nr:PcfJ domain-containing protein [Lachnospiraceae bacterium]